MTLVAFIMTVFSVSTQNGHLVEHDLEHVGSGVTLPQKYITGRARIDFLGKNTDLLLYNLENGEDATVSQKIDITKWQVLHLEFEQLPDGMQVVLGNENGKSATTNLDNTKNPSAFDIDISSTNLDKSVLLKKLALRSTPDTKEDRTVIITKCYLKSSNDDNADELPLYYKPSQDYSSFHERIVWSDAKLLSGSVVFPKENTQLGGDSWGPKAELANAINAMWTIELNSPLPSNDFQLKVEDNQKGYYYGQKEGQSVIIFDFSKRNASYAPSALDQIKTVYVRYTGKDGATLDTKSVKLTLYVKVNPAGTKIILGKDGLSTFTSDDDVDFSSWESDGINAYVATGYNPKTGNFIMQKVGSAKAGQGVLLKGEEGEEVTVVSSDSPIYTLNLLKGALDDVTITKTEGSYTNFRLADGGNDRTFYYLDGIDAVTIPAGKAYLQLPTDVTTKATSGNAAKDLRLEFANGETTGISVINGEVQDKPTIIYDLQGRRVSKPQRGVYIVNGKKVIIK